MSMSRIDCVRTAFAGGVTPRIPVMAHNFMMATREAGVTHRAYRENPETMARTLTDATLEYDLDCVLLDVDTALLASACGADVVYPEDAPAVVKGVQTRSYAELLDVLPTVDLLASTRVQVYLEAARRMVAWGNANDRFIRINADQGAFSLACLLRGMDAFLMDLLDPERAEDVQNLLEATFKIAVKMHELCAATGAHMTSYGNSSEGCSVISPRMFRKFCKARETRLAADLKARGIPTICHICGNVTPILPDLIDTGCKAYELDWLTDIQGIHDQALGKFVLSGNVNPAIFSTGTPEEIYRESKAVCDLYRGQGGLVLCSGCAIGPDTTEANMRAFVQAALDK